MRNHVLAVGWIHLAVGLFVLVCISLLWFSAANLESLIRIRWIPQVIAWVGKPVAIFLLVVAVSEIIGAVGLLRQQAWARPVLLGVSALELFVVPVGTAVAGYTFWVLWRK